MLSRIFCKILHDLGAAGVIGAFATILLLASIAPDPAVSLSSYADYRRGIALVSKWLLVPALFATICSGLLAMMANRAYLDQGWAWLKAALGVAMFEGTLVSVDATARKAAELAAAASAEGVRDPAALAALLRTERGGLWTLLVLAIANVVIAVWRPRFVRLP